MYRYAIYFCPDEDTPLGTFGTGWLGRTPDGRELGPPALEHISEPVWKAATSAPRRYGFHATLKPPFRLAAGITEQDLNRAVESFCQATQPVPLGRLTVQHLSGFTALRPEQNAPVNTFAGKCVQTFDRFRAPSTAEEIARRRPDTLTERQRRLLESWGYPYVMEEFRFHMTLTGRLTEPETTTFRKTLEARYAPLVDQSVTISDICLLRQETREDAFILAGRYALSGD